MEEKIPSNENEPQPQTPPPANEDVQQFSRWMTEYGRPALIGLAVAVVVLLGISVWRGQKESKAAAAVQALFQNKGPEELLGLAWADPEAPTAPMALASAAAEFYAQNRYDEALDAYQRFAGLYTNHMLSADAALGVAASLEALDRFDEAFASYEAFATANPTHALQPQAVFGAARCREQLGQFDEARALYEDFIAAHPESTWLPQAESGLLFLKKAERAKNMPAPAVPVATEDAPEAVHEMGADPDGVVDATSAAMEESVETAMAEEMVGEETVPAVEEEKAVPEKPKQKKTKSSKKKKVVEEQSEAGTGESAPE